VADLSGQTIDGKYQLEKIAGEGGMATVYKAIVKGAAGFQRRVAVKHIRPEFRALKNYIDMFVEEARVGSELAHPNIVQVHDFVGEGGNYYLIMEWVEGIDLGAFIQAYRERKQHVPWPLVAGIGIAWMYAREVSAADPRHLIGTLVAIGVPVAAAVNWALIQHTRQRADVDLLPAVLIGAAMSAAITLPLSTPFAASAHDLALLALLGVVQLAVPCLMSVAAARYLSAPEASLLALLEVVFGVAWAWWGAGEAPAVHVLGGGALVLVALAGNEALAMRKGSSIAA